MSSSTSSQKIEWNRTDDLIVNFSSSTNPLDRGFEGLEDLLEPIEALGLGLTPNRIFSGKRKRKYSRQTLWAHLNEMTAGSWTAVTLDSTVNPAISFQLQFQAGDMPERFEMELRINPMALTQEPQQADGLARHLTDLVRALAQRFPLSRGFCHSCIDHYMGQDRPSAEQPGLLYKEVYWLNLYGRNLVDALGRERVLSTPASHLEELADGSVLFLTRPTPADFDSEEARLAQARALVHLHLELEFDTVLAELRRRSLAFSPIPITFDEDVADILLRKVEFRGLMNKRWDVERFNAYHPPPVSEWVPADQAPPPDVDDVNQTIETYEGLYAEQFVALMHSEKVRHVMEGALEALPEVDFAFWHRGWGEMDADEKEAMLPALGAWLGMKLVYPLGGRWVPRRNLEETLVVVGSRAWLPFLRARHALQSRDAPLDFSCTQLFRQARRFATHSRIP